METTISASSPPRSHATTELRPILEVSNIAKAYGDTRALAGVSLVVRPGEFVVLLGLNGAGKTTLLQILTGLFSADSGDVRIFGLDARRHPVRTKAFFGVVFQQPTLDLELSVRSNLRYHADLHGLDRRTADARIDEELLRLDLADQKRRPARFLSGGNRRRVELARAMLHNPALLLMDEATVGLDPGSRAAILARIHSLKAEAGLGILWTTHLIDEAERADRVVVLHRGRILFDGQPGELLAQRSATALADAFLDLTGAAGKSAAP